jgi:hypothetical protein
MRAPIGLPFELRSANEYPQAPCLRFSAVIASTRAEADRQLIQSGTITVPARQVSAIRYAAPAISFHATGCGTRGGSSARCGALLRDSA